MIKLKLNLALLRTQLRTGAEQAGSPRPSSPQPVYAEDLSLLVRNPRRLRLKRGLIRVLN